MQENLLRPAALPTWGQRTALRMLNLIGWNVYFKPLPGPHGIAVVYPHTSNYDFFVGLLAKWAVGLHFRWLAKNSLFRGPMGIVMRYWGGVPVDRSAPQGAIRRLADDMLGSKWFWLAITPEATRSYRPNWKSGFYHLALEAKVPLCLVYIDYPNKTLGVVDHLHLSGDQEADLAAIRAVYEGHRGRFPKHQAPIVLQERRAEERR